MKGQFFGKLIGARTFTKDGVTKVSYQVFVPGELDKDTGLYSSDCEIVRVLSDIPIPNAKPNMQVVFFGEVKTFQGRSYTVYSDISPVK